jgi:hypothetical protein
MPCKPKVTLRPLGHSGNSAGFTHDLEARLHAIANVAAQFAAPFFPVVSVRIRNEYNVQLLNSVHSERIFL